MEKYNLNEYIKKLQEKEQSVKTEEDKDFAKIFIDNLSYNSLDVTNNTLFVCKGKAFKEEYLDAAIKKGAVAYISETDCHNNIPCV